MVLKWVIVAGSTSLLAGCVESTPVMAPDGRQGFVITCKYTVDCFKQAARNCPQGYEMVDSDRETRAAVVNGNLMVAQRKQIFIACRPEPPAAITQASPQ
jgi:hypothetical protein